MGGGGESSLHSPLPVTSSIPVTTGMNCKLKKEGSGARGLGWGGGGEGEGG